MISFQQATDRELTALGDAIDSLTLAGPERIHIDRAWSAIVHAFANESVARNCARQAA